MINFSLIFVKSLGGVDIDPDDDGNPNNDTDKDVNGVMSTIVTLEEINNTIVNPVSTLVAIITKGENDNALGYILLDSGKVDQEKLEKRIKSTLEGLGLKDIDNDGKITLKDVNEYDMVKNHSDLEKAIRKSGFLASIHSGENSPEKQNFLNEKKKNINGVIVERRTEENSTYVKLIPLGKETTVQYRLDSGDWQNYDSEILIEKETLITFREVYWGDGVYSKTKQILVGGDSSSEIIEADFSYNPEKLHTEEGLQRLIGDLKDQKTKLGKKITDLETKKEDLEQEITNTEARKGRLKNSLNQEFTNLEGVSKAILNPNYTVYEKKGILNTDLAGYSGDTHIKAMNYLKRIRGKSSSDIYRNSASVSPETADINGAIEALTIKREEINEQIPPLEQEVQDKYDEYLTKKQKYDTIKEMYDEDQENFKFRQEEVKKYEREIKDINLWIDYYEGEIISNKKAKKDAEEFYRNIYIPDSSDYDLDTKYYPSLVGEMSFESYTHRNTTYEIFFILSSGRFPGYVAASLNGSTGKKYFVSNMTHAKDSIKALRIKINYGLNIEHFKDLIAEKTTQKNNCIKDKERAEKNKDDATFNKDLYGAFTMVSDEFYKDALAEYEKAQRRLDRAKDRLRAQNDRLDEIDAEIRALKAKLEELGIVLQQIEEKEVEAVKCLTEKEQVSASYKEVENEIIAYEEQLGQVDTLNDELIEDKVNSATGSYSPPINFVEDTTTTWDKENEIVQYRTSDLEAYKEYPFTIYVKFNRKGEGLKFPALVWAEYKLDADDKMVYTTERIEVYSEEELDYEGSEGVMGFLEKKVKERIDFLINGMNENVLHKTYDVVEEYYQNGGDIEKKLEFFALYFLEYKFKKDENFKATYDNYMEEMRKKFEESSENYTIEEVQKFMNDFTESINDLMYRQSKEVIKENLKNNNTPEDEEEPFDIHKWGAEHIIDPTLGKFVSFMSRTGALFVPMASIFLQEGQNTYSLLFYANSMKSHPEDLYFDNESCYVKEFKKTDDFDKLEEDIKDGIDKNLDSGIIEGEMSDALNPFVVYTLNKYNYMATYYKRRNGKYFVEVTINDIYDFNRAKNDIKNFLAKAQDHGFITPFDVQVNLNFEY